MMHAKIETVGVETQREVVKEEKRQRMDNQPYGSILPEILKHAYTVHPYRWPTPSVRWTTSMPPHSTSSSISIKPTTFRIMPHSRSR